MKKRKSWREKLADDKDLPKVVPIPGRMKALREGGTVVVAAPREVEELMRCVPAGRVTTIQQLCEALARRHHATMGCPLTTGIFAWIAANAAEECRAETGRIPTPYWRTLKASGEINPKYPGGAEAAAALLCSEGHTVRQRGARFYVTDFKQTLFKPE
jgi:alkylated DNA nucleotide flippase Atl1